VKNTDVRRRNVKNLGDMAAGPSELKKHLEVGYARGVQISAMPRLG
jgi:hypothetical protein